MAVELREASALAHRVHAPMYTHKPCGVQRMFSRAAAPALPISLYYTSERRAACMRTFVCASVCVWRRSPGRQHTHTPCDNMMSFTFCTCTGRPLATPLHLQPVRPPGSPAEMSLDRKYARVKIKGWLCLVWMASRYGMGVNESSHLVSRYLPRLIYTIRKVFVQLGKRAWEGVDGDETSDNKATRVVYISGLNP